MEDTFPTSAEPNSCDRCEGMAAGPGVQQTFWNVDEGRRSKLPNGSWICRSRRGTAESESVFTICNRITSEYGTRPGGAQANPRRGPAIVNVIETEPMQFASEVVGRLLPHRERPAIDWFIGRIADGAPAPWIRPLQPHKTHFDAVEDIAGSRVEFSLRR